MSITEQQDSISCLKSFVNFKGTVPEDLLAWFVILTRSEATLSEEL